jgi:hypothetical protein
MTIEALSATVAIPESGQEAVMNAASGSRVTGGMLFLLAGLAALGAQMGCAAMGASFASTLPFSPSVSLAVILTTGSALALLVFLPVALHQPRAELSGISESTGE